MIPSKLNMTPFILYNSFALYNYSKKKITIEYFNVNKIHYVRINKN